MKKTNKIVLIALAVAVVAISAILVVVLTAPKKYELAFDTNQVSNMQSVTVKEGTEYTLPTPEVLADKQFQGWYLTSDFSGESVTSVVVNANTTVYAKYEQLYLLKLDVDGGNFDKNTEWYLHAGDNVSEFVKDFKPTKTDLQFGEWYNGNLAIGANFKMPKNQVDLKARYKMAYTIEVYKQNLQKNDYELTIETYYDYAGTKLNPQLRFDGFTECANDNAIYSITLSKEENVLRSYFDRNEVTVSFYSNYPDSEAEERSESNTVVYGNQVEVLSDFTFEGYILLGWATSKNSKKIDYKANYINSVLYGFEGEITNEKIVPSSNVVLYAVWTKGLTDMFGGEDLIYSIEDNIYLYRGGVLFEGIKRENNRFTFKVPSKPITGKVINDEFYCYSDSNRAVLTATFNQDKNVTILLDQFNGLSYTCPETDDNDKTVIKEYYADYYINEDGLYVATFEDTTKFEQPVSFLIYKEDPNDENSANYFQMCNNAEVEMGAIKRLAVSENQLTYYVKDDVYAITLNGFDTATYNNYDANTNSIKPLKLKYRKEKDGTITLISGGQIAGVIKITEQFLKDRGVYTYAFYYQDQDVTLTAENGATLSTDGMFNAEYKYNGQVVSGIYSTQQSVFAEKTIYNITDSNGVTHKYLLTTNKIVEEKDDVDSDQPATTTTTYVIEEKLNTYAEFFYVDETKVQFTVVIVFDDEVANRASIYGYTADQKYIKLVEGSYDFDSETHKYTFNADKWVEVDEDVQVREDIVEFGKIKTIEFGVSSVTTSNNVQYNVTFWYSYTMTDDVKTEYAKVYTDKQNQTLTLVKCFAVYGNDIGMYQINEGIITMSFANGMKKADIDEENMTFEIHYLPEYTSTFVDSNGYIIKTDTIKFDGKGNAEYSYAVENEPAEGEEPTISVVKVNGTIEDTNKKNESGWAIYKFTSEEVTFYYFEMGSSNGSAVYFWKYDENAETTYENDLYGRLIIDGCGYYGKFIDSMGNQFEGMYSINENNAVILYTQQKNFYFDVNESSFTVRGDEYATYLVRDNLSYKDYYISLDGYSNATVFVSVPEQDEEGQEGETAGEVIGDKTEEVKYVKEVIAETTYDLNDRIITLTYNDGSKEITLVGQLGTVTEGNKAYNVITLLHTEIVTILVNSDDWSVLVLDEVSNAVKYDENGNKQQGYYKIISSSLLYFQTNDGSDACIYRYDLQEGYAKQVKLNTVSYYTEDFESLVFTSYGYARFNGTDSYFYDKDKAGNYWIYREDPSNESAGEYGFVKDSISETEGDKITYNGKTYTRTNGYALEFSRLQATENDYPVLVNSELGKLPLQSLSFQPKGTAEFEKVQGTVFINDTRYTCYVSRVKNEDDSFSTYVTIGSYRFDIVLKFLGEDENGLSLNTYEVVDLTYNLEILSSQYTYQCALYYQYLGIVIPNTLGTFNFVKKFDKFGETISDTLEINVTDEAKLLDVYGKTIALKGLEYTYDENNGLYSTQFELEGYKYSLKFAVNRSKYLTSKYEYAIFYLTCVQSFEVGDYKVEFNYVLSSDYYQAGTNLINLYEKDGENQFVLVDLSQLYKVGDDVYGFVRTFDEQGKMGSKSYLINFDYKKMEGDNAPNVYEYTNITVVAHNAKTYFTEDKLTFVDYDEKNKFLGMGVIGDKNSVSYFNFVSCDYNEQIDAYIVKLSNGDVCLIKVTDGVLTYVKADKIMNAEKLAYAHYIKDYTVIGLAFAVKDENSGRLLEKYVKATNCSYDSTTQTYLVTLENGEVYTVKFDDDKAIITLVTSEENA